MATQSYHPQSLGLASFRKAATVFAINPRTGKRQEAVVVGLHWKVVNAVLAAVTLGFNDGHYPVPCVPIDTIEVFA